MWWSSRSLPWETIYCYWVMIYDSISHETLQFHVSKLVLNYHMNGREGRLLLHQMHAVYKEFSTLIWDLLLNLGWLRTVSGTPPQIDAICFSCFPYFPCEDTRVERDFARNSNNLDLFLEYFIVSCSWLVS